MGEKTKEKHMTNATKMHGTKNMENVDLNKTREANKKNIEKDIPSTNTWKNNENNMSNNDEQT